jgi:isopentenyl diphosphate isomerase/L-lactate dehydrogenase-like FMN-dependent dehydrogenase
MTEQPFAGYQYEIYFQGLAGKHPELPTNLDRLEQLAESRLPRAPFGYVAGGAGTESTVHANRRAFERWRLLPRMLHDVGSRDLSCNVLGSRLAAPVVLAPVGVQSIVHPDGELASARAAAGVGLAMCVSTASSHPLEDVARELGTAPRWFQLYWPKERAVTRSLLRRAEDAGYGAVLVTLDTWLLAWRPRDLDEAYLPFLQSEGIANYLSDPAFQAGLAKPVAEDPAAAVGHFLQMFADPTKTWADLAFLRECTSLPLVLKGVLHPGDAARAVEAGVDGVAVSNHGGRQVDGAVGALDALPAVVEAVGGRCAVLFDSGVRSGADVVKALALGADAVMVGRPYMYGLGLAGEDGVRHVLRSLLADLDLTVALCGCTSLPELTRELLVPAAGPG